MGREMFGKISRWPDLVGKTYIQARAQILSDRPGINVEELKEGDIVSVHHDPNRVRVFTSRPGHIVVEVPYVG
ncbi:hypothetical protein ACP70R_032715 [Stipagrostis hirtigluma subsp. patula]